MEDPVALQRATGYCLLLLNEDSAGMRQLLMGVLNDPDLHALYAFTRYLACLTNMFGEAADSNLQATLRLMNTTAVLEGAED